MLSRQVEWCNLKALLRVPCSLTLASNSCYLARLDGVSSRFQETSAEFEQARNKARKAKIEFETVKKNRLVALG